MHTIDINCDFGESYGRYKLGADPEILDYVTSVNIACGFHAGDPTVMRQTVQLAADRNVAIGAHPGLQDLVGFGRRNMDVSAQDTYDIVVYQIGALAGVCSAAGTRLSHVKPHGALYNMAAQRRDLAEAIAEAVRAVDRQLVLFGLYGSELVLAGNNVGLKTVNEVFADRTYQQDGSLTPRTQKDAMLPNKKEAVEQVLRMIKHNVVRTQQGIDAPIQAGTVCIHGDGQHALAFAREIHNKLLEENIKLQFPAST